MCLEWLFSLSGSSSSKSSKTSTQNIHSEAAKKADNEAPKRPATPRSPTDRKNPEDIRKPDLPKRPSTPKQSEKPPTPPAIPNVPKKTFPEAPKLGHKKEEPIIPTSLKLPKTMEQYDKEEYEKFLQLVSLNITSPTQLSPPISSPVTPNLNKKRFYPLFRGESLLILNSHRDHQKTLKNILIKLGFSESFMDCPENEEAAEKLMNSKFYHFIVIDIDEFKDFALTEMVRKSEFCKASGIIKCSVNEPNITLPGQLGSEKNVVHVSSHYDKNEISRAFTQLGAKLLPPILDKVNFEKEEYFDAQDSTILRL